MNLSFNLIYKREVNKTYLARGSLKFLANLHLQSLSGKELAFDNHDILQGNLEEVAAYNMDFQSEMKVEPHFSQCLED